jgi:hypothetical protein
MDNCLVPFPAELTALTVKLDVPAAVGSPDITPVSARLKPAGNEPLSRLHVMGVTPVAASVWLYAVPTVPPGNVAVVIVGEAATIVMDNSLVPFPAELAALTVKLDVPSPSAVGVPEIVPVSSARLKPAGNVPLSRCHVMGVSPLAASVWLYATPTVPPGNVVVVIAGAPPLVIVMDNCLVSLPVALVALTVKVYVFAVVGIPEITLVPARLKPAGNEPLSRLHVMGLSPVAASVSLYATPSFPSGNDVLVIAGAVPCLPPPVPLPSPQAPKENPIIATMTIIPDNLILFFIKHTPCYWAGSTSRKPLYQPP